MELGQPLDKTDDPRKYAWLLYFRKLADLYGLKDWTLEISSGGTDDPDAIASMYCPPGRKHGWLRLSQAFLDESPTNQRMIALHELTHCHTAMWYQHSRMYIKEEMRDTHRVLMEYGVDSIACAITELFPLPGVEDEVRGH